MVARRPAPPALELRGIKKRYAGSTVLNGVDLSLAEHEVVCLIGASGSGKSTRLRGADLLDSTARQIFLQQRKEPNELAAGTDCWQQSFRAVTDQQDQSIRGRLFKGLQQSISTVKVHSLSIINHGNPPFGGQRR